MENTLKRSMSMAVRMIPMTAAPQTTPNSVQPIFGLTPRRAQSARGV